MKVKILNQFDYQTYPFTEDMVEVDETLLARIGKDKKFDTVSKIIVDYDNSAVLRKQEAEKEIAELKAKLRETDYKAIKYAEGELSAEEYAPVKEQRKAWRAEINQLEKELEGLEE